MKLRGNSTEFDMYSPRSARLARRLGALVGGAILVSSPFLSGCASSPCEKSVAVDGPRVTVRSPEDSNRAVYVSATSMPENEIKLEVSAGMMDIRNLVSAKYNEQEATKHPVLQYDFDNTTELNIKLVGEEVYTYCTPKEQK